MKMIQRHVSTILEALEACGSELRAATTRLDRSEAVRAAHQIASAKWDAECAEFARQFPVLWYGPNPVHFAGYGYCWEEFSGWVVSPLPPADDGVAYLAVDRRGNAAECHTDRLREHYRSVVISRQHVSRCERYREENASTVAHAGC